MPPRVLDVPSITLTRILTFDDHSGIAVSGRTGVDLDTAGPVSTNQWGGRTRDEFREGEWNGR